MTWPVHKVLSEPSVPRQAGQVAVEQPGGARANGAGLQAGTAQGERSRQQGLRRRSRGERVRGRPARCLIHVDQAGYAVLCLAKPFSDCTIKTAIADELSETLMPHH